MKGEKGFTILRYRGDVPVFAGCAWCGLKFIAPRTLVDRQEAREYLWTKYQQHHCVIRTGSKREEMFLEDLFDLETSARK
jgi:hypothetical protein